MTGFGSGEAKAGKTLYKVELRSLNGKTLDINVKLPVHLKLHEASVRKALAEIVRGKTDAVVTEEKGEESAAVQLNLTVMQHYYAQLEQFARENKTDTSGMMKAILALPNVISEQSAEENPEEIKQALVQATQAAVHELFMFREKEGESQYRDLEEKVSEIESCIPQIEQFESGRIERVRQRIMQEISNLEPDIQTDAGRLEQELIFYVEKLDINEEKVRLQAHINYFREVMQQNSTNEKGRKLSFITQEMGREINTIGSKANDSDIQKIVVGMKDNLEKIKEQTFNIL